MDVLEFKSPMTVPVPSYRLKNTGIAEVMTGWSSSTVSRDAQITIPMLSSSTEFLMGGGVSC